MDVEELRLKFVSEDGVSAVAARVGGAIGSLTGIMHTQGAEQAALWDKMTSVTQRRAAADLAAAERARDYINVQMKVAEAERARQAAQEAAAKGSEDASLLEVRAMKLEQDAEVSRLALTKKAVDESIAAHKREATEVEASAVKMKMSWQTNMAEMGANAQMAFAVAQQVVQWVEEAIQKTIGAPAEGTCTRMRLVR